MWSYIYIYDYSISYAMGLRPQLWVTSTRASQVTSGLLNHALRDSHPVLQVHANLRVLLPLLRLAPHYAQSRARHTCPIRMEVSLEGLDTTASCANLAYALPTPRY